MASDQFNAFHLDVACLSERLRWVLDRLPPVDDADLQAGLDVFAVLIDQLDALVEDRAEFMATRAPVVSLVKASGSAREL